MNKFLTAGIASFILLAKTTCFADNTKPMDLSNISPADKAKIEEIVHQYLLRKPEVIVEAVQALQKQQFEQTEKTVKQTQATASTFAKDLFHQDYDAMAGNKDGKITIVEFFDYQCPHCAEMVPVINAIIKANPDVRFVFKDFTIRGPVSEFAAKATLAANKQGKYYEFSHALLQQTPPLNNESVLKIAKDKGLDVDKMKKDMDSKEISDVIKANNQLAQSLKLFGTPAFFIGKTNEDNSINYYPGKLDQQQLQAAIDKTKNS